VSTTPGNLQNKVRQTDPMLVVNRVLLSVLKLDPQNPRFHSRKQIGQIADSIRIFGFVSPILIDRDHWVIAGHGRVAAAKLIGMKEVPAIRLEDMTENQRLAYAITDNKLNDNSTWNKRFLGEQLRVLVDAGLNFDITVMGIELSEIELRIEGLTTDTAMRNDPDYRDTLVRPGLLRPKEETNSYGQSR
jgi:ParB-like chromosome segregation protein Spo0J